MRGVWGGVAFGDEVGVEEGGFGDVGVGSRAGVEVFVVRVLGHGEGALRRRVDVGGGEGAPMRCLKCGSGMVAAGNCWDCPKCWMRWFPERGAFFAAYVDRGSRSGEYAWVEVPVGCLAVLGEVP